MQKDPHIICMLTLPEELMCDLIFPFLSVRDLQALDASYTGTCHRSHLKILWKSYCYASENVLDLKDLLWLHRIGVQILALALTWSEEEEESEIWCCVLNMPKLREFHVEQYISDNKLLFRLAESCPELEVLRLSRGEYDDSGVISLAQHCPKLHTIQISSYDISDAALYELCSKCSHLKHIFVSDCCNLSDASLAVIASTFPHLHSIGFKGHKFTDAGLISLADKCHELQSVTVRGYSSDTMTNIGFAALWRANPLLSRVDISCRPIVSDDDILLLVKCCPRLQQIDIGACKRITDTAVIAIAEHCPALNSLNIRYCEDISDAALIALGQHSHDLKSINISRIKNITDVGVVSLAKGCPFLHDFNAHSTNITDDGMRALATQCRDLIRIDVCSCKFVGLETISTLTENCPLITELYLSGSKGINDACLYAIAQHCRNLTVLHCTHTAVSDPAAVQAITASCRMLAEFVCVGCIVDQTSKKNLMQLKMRPKSFEL